MSKYFVRMDSAVTGATLAGDRFEAATPAEARNLAEAAFSNRLTPADCEGMSPDMTARILAADAAHGEAMAAGVTYHVRKCKESGK